jgi:hypothetical protein
MKLLEFYQEEPGGSFTHNGREYLLNPLLKFTDKLPVKEIPISELEWVIDCPYEDDGRDIDDRDISVPVLVADYNGKLAVIDGYHRLLKAIKIGKKTLPTKFVNDRFLTYFEILSDEISESFNSHQNINVAFSGSEEFITVRTIGDREIRFVASLILHNDWDIEFLETRGKSGNSHGKTGEGFQMQVFSFVLSSIKLFVKKYNPVCFEFTSAKADGNRTRLYKSIANKIKIPGYYFTVETAGPVDVFRFIYNP